MKHTFPSGRTKDIVILKKSDRPRVERPLRKPMGLGDWTERVLQHVGVTEDRYKEAKELFGLTPTCNCPKRKEWLNKVSDWWAGNPDASRSPG